MVRQHHRLPPLSVTHPLVCKWWHPTKNGLLRPSDLTIYDRRKTWWLCSDNPDHEWQQRPEGAVNIGCPHCKMESRSLLKHFPEIAQEWHPSKNGILSPSAVTAMSGKKVWWLCRHNAQHVWQATVGNRTGPGHRCPFCTNRLVDETNSLAATHPDLTSEWHPVKNGTLSPNDLVAGSHQKVWWLCAKTLRHNWRAVVKKRAFRGDGCPECANERLRDDNRLSVLFPEIASEWHPTKNRHLYPTWQNGLVSYTGDNKPPKNRRVKPSDFPAFSQEKVWWQCRQNKSHEWIAKIAARTANHSKCPYCAGRKVSADNNLAAKYPGVAKMWHPTRNKDVQPTQVLAGSDSKFWWRCFKSAQHVWQESPGQMVASRRDGATGCPYCSGRKVGRDNNLLARAPVAAKLWHLTKNGTLRPSQVTARSLLKAWWICPKVPAHVWQAPVKSVFAATLKGNSGCPYCKGRRVGPDNSLRAKYPELSQRWDKSRNFGLSPAKVTHGSLTIVWWRCPTNRQHVWQAPVVRVVRSFKQGHSGCPVCAATRRKGVFK